MFFKNLYYFKSRFTACMINTMASYQKTTTIKTLRKWEKEFQLKLDFDINTEYKVCCIQFKGEPHLQVVKLSKWSELGIKVYQDVIMNLALPKSFLRLNPANNAPLWAKFNIMYYVLKKERPFTDYPDLLNLQSKNGISKLGASYSTPDASAYFAGYIGKVKQN